MHWDNKIEVQIAFVQIGIAVHLECSRAEAKSVVKKRLSIGDLPMQVMPYY